MSTSYRLPYDNVIDADGHIVEPPDVWEKYIDPQFRDRTMRIRTNSQGYEYMEIDGHPSKFFDMRLLSLVVTMGQSAEEASQLINKPYHEVALFGAMDAKERVQLLDQEGLMAAILYPTLGLAWECEVEDPELAAAY